MILQVIGLLASGFALALLQREDSVVENLTESVVVEVANWHLGILAFAVQVLLHLLEHLLLLTRAHSLFESLFLLSLIGFLIGVEFELLSEYLGLGLLPVAVLELSFYFSDFSLVF